MKRKLHLSFLLCVLLSLSGALTSFAQPRCGFDAMHQDLLAKSPEYAKAVAAQDAAIRKVIEDNLADPSLQQRRVVTGTDTVYEIPLVLHVIHTGGAIGSTYNPSDAQLLGMIAYLNQSYEATWPAYASVALGGTKVPLRFVMAQRTPACAATSGIVRVNGSGLTNYTTGGVMRENTSGGVTDSALKSLSIWPANQYYNIWIVNRIDAADGNSPGTFIAGYATFPGGLSYMDGTVMLASQAVAGGKTLPHEIGHAFSLYHTFEGSGGPTGSVCPANVNCLTQGDQVCDTDPTNHDAFFSCPSGNNPCTGLPWNNQQTNFMHYTSCADQRFTTGQKNRIMASLLVARPGLNTSQALTPPPAVAMTAATCTPASIANPNNQFGMGPGRVKLNTLDDSSLTYTNTLKFYEDNTCNLGTTLVVNQTYPISVSTALNDQIARAYIDYNDDGTFGAGEQILNSTVPLGIPNYTHTANVLVPAAAIQNKRLRLRVVADYAANTTLGACSNPQYGQVEDYYVIVVPNDPLAIRIYAEAIAVQGNAVNFSFKAAEQEQVKSYKLQRANPDMKFETVQEFPLSANGTYTLKDGNLPSGTYYYRILATEYDGNDYFSRTLAAVVQNTTTAAAGLQLYPNPAKENFELVLPMLPQSEVRVIMTDIYGKKIMEQNFAPQTQLKIHNNLKSGIYFLSVIADHNKWTQKLVIAR